MKLPPFPSTLETLVAPGSVRSWVEALAECLSEVEHHLLWYARSSAWGVPQRVQAFHWPRLVGGEGPQRGLPWPAVTPSPPPHRLTSAGS